MPELPEVETVRRGLAAQIVGRTFAGIAFLEWPRTIAAPEPGQLAARIAGRRVRGVDRRAKFIVVDLDGGEHLVVHLRMTGQLRVLPADAPRDRFERVAFAFADGDELRFSDIRRFGRIALLDDAELVTRFRDLGPEPLADDWRAADFAAALAARRTRLKPLLLDQSFLAGLGNIYVDEALFRAGLHPLAVAAEVPPARAAALHAAIRELLTEAIASGGTTFSNYRDAFGQEGDYFERRRVYGRADEPCPTCGTAIARIVVGGRGTHLCPSCQPAPEEDGRGTRDVGRGANVTALPPTTNVADAPAAPSDRALFHERVFAIVARIPRGRVTTYGSIARAIGHARAARMVGWALHASHPTLGLPCHRVINRNGELTGRWHWGDPDLMRALLEDEGIAFDAGERVDLRRFGWWPHLECGTRNAECETGEAADELVAGGAAPVTHEPADD